MRRMVVWLQNFQGGQSSSKYPTYIVQFMISPQMRFSWPKKWEKQSFSSEKMVIWLHNFWGGLSSSKYTILNHFWLGQLKPPRLTQCEVYELVGHAGVEGAVLHIDAPVRFVRTDVPGHLGQLISPTLQELLSLAVIASFTTFADKQAVRGAGGDHWLGLKVWVGGCQTNQLLHHNGVSLTILTPYKLESQDYFAHKTHQARLPKDLVSLFSLVPYLRGNTGWRWLEVWLFHCQWRTWRPCQTWHRAGSRPSSHNSSPPQ